MILIGHSERRIEVGDCFDSDNELELSVITEWEDDVILWIDESQVKMMADHLNSLLKTKEVKDPIEQAKRIASKFGANIHELEDTEDAYLMSSFPYRLNNSLVDYVETHFEVIEKVDQFVISFKIK